jgi:uncharacterized protein involved in exopolysaccharide biosynthesis
MLLILAVVLGPTVYFIRRIPPIYESRAEVLIESARSTEQLVSAVSASVGVAQLDTVGYRVNPISNQAALITSRPVFKQALQLAGIPESKASLGALDAQPISGTDLIRISYRSNSPEQARKIVDAVVQIYTQQNLVINREKATAAREYLEKQLPVLLKEWQAAQDRLEQFQTKNRFLGTDAETSGISRSLMEMQGWVNTAQAELALINQKIGTLRAQLPGDLTSALRVAGLNQDAGYQSLQKQLLEAETDLAALQTRYTDANDQVKAALDKRDRIKALLADQTSKIIGEQTDAANLSLDPVRRELAEQWFQLEVERAAKVAQLGQFSQQLAQVQGRNNQLPQLVKEQVRLQTEVDKAQQKYLAFAERYTASEIIEQQSLGNVRLVEPANLSWRPVAPRKQFLYSLALAGSLAAALGAVWLRRLRSNTLDGTLALKEILPMPILAMIPWRGDGRLASLEPTTHHLLLDHYQLLQAHLRMLPRSVQVIGVCSWTSSEGSSLVAENLALLEAQYGRCVLLVDTQVAQADLPKFRKFYPTSHPSALANGDPEAEDSALLGFDIMSYCIETSLVFYKKWSMILERMRQQYDLVIIDCPPASQGSNATMLASLADGILWVVDPEQVGRRGAEASSEALQSWNTRLLGQVIMGETDGSLPTLPVGSRLNTLTGAGVSALTQGHDS